jgi:hypothetical protein
MISSTERSRAYRKRQKAKGIKPAPRKAYFKAWRARNRKRLRAYYAKYRPAHRPAIRAANLRHKARARAART